MAQANFGWVADITDLWTLEGWLYLAVILDLFSRREVGWSMSERLEKKLVVLDALSAALADRNRPRTPESFFATLRELGFSP